MHRRNRFIALAAGAALFMLTVPGLAFAGQATLTWTAPTTNTNGSALTDLAGYKVHYGTASGSYTNSIDAGNATAYTISNLAEGYTYYFAVTAYNASGGESSYSAEKFKQIVPDTAGPSITGVYSTDVTMNGVTIGWATDEASDAQVEYGTTTDYGSTTARNGTMTTAHSQALSGLQSSTTYNYRVMSSDAAGNSSVSGNYTFTTIASADTGAPVITNVRATDVTAAGASIKWETDEPSSTEVTYSAGGADSYSDRSLTTVHTAVLSGLSGFTSYSFTVKSVDAAGNAATSAGTFKTSNTAPSVSLASSVASGTIPLAAEFTATAADADGAVVKYEWDFDGDGVYDADTGSVPSASNTYSGVGNYNARVKVTDDGGAFAESGFVAISAESATNKPPVIASVLASIVRSLTVEFDISASDSNGGVIVSFKWDFDGNGTIDATTSTAPAQYTYKSAGTYNPVVTVTDDQGGVAKAMTTVTVTETSTGATEEQPSSSTGGSSAKGGGCFIATVAYGSYLEPEVVVLRKFRDNVLLANPLGRSFVSVYYRFSPPVAEFISRHETLRGAARAALTPLVMSIKHPQAALAVLMSLGVGVAVFVRLRDR